MPTCPNRRLDVVYVLPSRYDDDGYVNRYWRGVLPSNTLACLKSLTASLAESKSLGGDVEMTVTIYDDSVQRVPVERIVRRSRRRNAKLVVGLVGVQSNQFPRASDIAKEFRARGAQVMIGGFHVSGVLAMFPRPTRELQELLDAGVTLVRGEVEAPGALEGILRDALNNAMKPVYAILDPPDLTHAAVPQPDASYMRRFVFKRMGTIDTSRGCPFNCSFCTIIQVQGRRMRHRSVESILNAIESNHARGVDTYFFTDDNLARSPVWEPLFEGLARLRAAGKPVTFMMQVDTQAWKIPGFVNKAQAAGCYLVFVGMETVNPENIADAGKRQNKVNEFAEMVRVWHHADVLVEVGYIIGFPHDTIESVRRDIAFLHDEVKVDEAAFFMLTPLPGSRDHQRMVEKRVPMDADLNNFDSFHETFRHSRIAPGQWYALYEEAWSTYYGKERIVQSLLRTSNTKYWRVFWLSLWNRYSTLLHSHPMVTGLFRLKGRRERRPIYPRESVSSYLRRRTHDWIQLGRIFAHLAFEFEEIWMLTRKKDDPRWAVLADLRDRWSAAQRGIAESRFAGRCDEAWQQVESGLHAISETLRQSCADGAAFGNRLRRRIQSRTGDIDTFVQSLKSQGVSWSAVEQAQQYVCERVLAGYEEAAIRYVAARRRFNAYRRELVGRLQSGRVLTLDVAPLPQWFAFEVMVACRFALDVCLRNA